LILLGYQGLSFAPQENGNDVEEKTDDHEEEDGIRNYGFGVLETIKLIQSFESLKAPTQNENEYSGIINTNFIPSLSIR
jgi:hypothetical protein